MADRSCGQRRGLGQKACPPRRPRARRRGMHEADLGLLPAPGGEAPLDEGSNRAFGNEDDRRPCMASERWPTSTMLKATLLCRAAPCQPKLG